MATVMGNKRTLPAAAMLAQERGQYVEGYVDFSLYPATTATDIIQVFALPEKTMVMACGYEIVTQGTAAATFGLGYDGGTELMAAGKALDGAVGDHVEAVNTSGNTNQTAKSLAMIMAAAVAVVGKVRIWAIVSSYAAI